MMRGHISYIILVIIAITLIILNGNYNPTDYIDLNNDSTSINDNSINGTISKVTDGDTIHVLLDDGTDITVRILGIDGIDISSDRIGKWTDMGLNENLVRACYQETKTTFINNWMNKRVTLLKDPNEDNIDRYDRYLRYVQMDNRDWGYELIQLGYGVEYDPTEKADCYYCSDYLELEQTVRSNKQGCLWNTELRPLDWN